MRTLRYSLVASCHSLVIVLGGGRAKEWTTKKRTVEIARPIPLYKKTLLHSPGGASARGPCGPNAIHQATIRSISVKYRKSMAFQRPYHVIMCANSVTNLPL